jgi:mannose-6-phosphate isomerase-like protein (cupin superfamily)
VTWSRIGVPVQRAKGRPTINLTGVTWERLTHDDDPFVDFLYVTYQPGSASCSEDDMMRHGGREYGHVISGRIDVRVGFEVHRLGAGDSIHFDSTAPHRLSNPYAEPCVAIWVVVGRRGDSRVNVAANPDSNHLPGLI